MHGGPGWVRPDGFERIEKELKLSSTQQEIIHGYLKEGRARMKELMSTVGPKMKEESLRTRELIKKELTPDQIVKLDEIMKRKEKDREKDKDRPRDRPPFPRLDSHDPSEKSPRSSPKPGEGQF